MAPEKLVGAIVVAAFLVGLVSGLVFFYIVVC